MVMRLLGCLLLAGWLTSSVRAEPPNVLFIAIDDLRNDLGSMGVVYAQSPEIDAFARTARSFNHHYVQVPTCGASRCALLRGRYPNVNAQVGNGAIKATQAEWRDQSLPGLFKAHHYRTLALGKITHHPGGLTGKEWAEGPEEMPGVWDRCWIPKGPWKTAEAIMHGYANGGARKPGKSPPREAFDGPDNAYPDAWVAQEAIETLGELAKSEQPWFFAVGFFKPHLPFAAPKKWHDLHEGKVPALSPAVAAKPAWPSGWHASGEFRGNYGHPSSKDPDRDAEYAQVMRESYAACVSYMDAQVGRVLKSVSQLGLDRNTIVVIWSDHGFLLGEHAIWGKHCLYEKAVRSPLMIRHPGLSQPGVASSAVVETVDVLPTLLDLAGIAPPSSLDGRSLRPQLIDPKSGTAKPAHSFWSDGQRAIRTDRWRLIAQQTADGKTLRSELFDLDNDPGETRNVASDQPELVADLLRQLARVPAPTTPNANGAGKKSQQKAD